MTTLLHAYLSMWKLTLGPTWEVPPGHLWRVEAFACLHGGLVGCVLVGLLMLLR